MLIVTDQDRPALRQPRRGSLHHPATGLAAARATLWPPVLTDRADVADVAALLDHLMPGRVVAPLVPAQVLLDLPRVGPLDDDRLHRRLQELHVGHIGPGADHPERAAVALDQQALLGARLAPVGGGLARLFPPEPGLAQHPVGRLPLPVHRPELVARLDQHCPDLLEDPVPAPPLEPAVHRAVVAELLGELVPLTAAAEAEDDPVERRPPVDPLAAAVTPGRRRCVLPQERLDPLPEPVGDLPDGFQRLGFSLHFTGAGSPASTLFT